LKEKSYSIENKELIMKRAKNFLNLNTFQNFYDAEIFKKNFEKNKQNISSKSMDILITDYGFDSNIIGCKLFESESNQNEMFGLSESQLENKFYQNKIVEEDDQSKFP
jgi:hypothetical protein